MKHMLRGWLVLRVFNHLGLQSVYALDQVTRCKPFAICDLHSYLEIAVMVGVPEYVMVKASPGDKPNMP
jgi:hypothetical protein